MLAILSILCYHAVSIHCKEIEQALLKQLIHNGIIVPQPPPYQELVLSIRGRPVQLTPKQEEMALAWAKKQGTPYVSDPVFAANFYKDFSAALGLDETLDIDEVDFGPVVRVVEREREARERLTPEERKAQAAIRKAVREELRDKYGHAIVNGEVVELGNYMTEPSGIFMGRGEHPLRGRWKEGAAEKDVTLNLSPDAPRPKGDWAEIVWVDALWVARWEDKLSGKLKYIWLSDTAPVKQQREAHKFDKAIELHEQIGLVRERIEQGLRDENSRLRMIAMACYLIDKLCLRVGDEKEADEADTVGATTLRPEHVTLHPGGLAEFDFLGKDSVAWHKELQLPPLVYQTMAELIANACPSSSAGSDEFHPTRDLPQLFPDIHSRNVNHFLSRIHRGLSAKVFRTHHATEAVRKSLTGSRVRPEDPEHNKWHAVAMANLEAAILCNHTKKDTSNWEANEQRYQERLEKAQERVHNYQAQLQQQKEAQRVLTVEAKVKSQTTASDKERARVDKRYQKRLEQAQKKTQAIRSSLEKAKQAVDKIVAQHEVAGHKRTWNLGTSLKSYIDPRVYHEWGQHVGYDVLEKYYPTTLRRKFAWIREQGDEKDDEEEDA